MFPAPAVFDLCYYTKKKQWQENKAWMEINSNLHVTYCQIILYGRIWCRNILAEHCFCKNSSCEETKQALAWPTILIEKTQTIVKQF